MLTNIYRGDYDTDADIEPAILEATREVFSRSVDKGIKQSHFDPSASFKKQIHHSADVFSAFRVHTMTKEVVSRLHDDNGHLRSFSEFAEAVQPYVSHQNRAWLQTEYSTAVRRAHDAADWQQFEAEKDVLPNLRWMPSTSAKPGQDHMEFWGTVLPVDDPFWKEHRPGDRWNCKCSLSSTDDEPTSRPTAKESTPQPGLKTKPTDAELFSQDHPYYADSCTSCPFRGSKLMALLHDLSNKKDCNSCGGVNRKLADTRKETIKRERPPKVDEYKEKYKNVFASPLHGPDELDENLRLGRIIAGRIHDKVYLLPKIDPVFIELRNKYMVEGTFEGKSPDFLIQGKLFEGKSMLGIKVSEREAIKNAIEKRIKAAKEQADNIILEIPERVSRECIHNTINNYLENKTHKKRIIYVIHGNKFYKYKNH